MHFSVALIVGAATTYLVVWFGSQTVAVIDSMLRRGILILALAMLLASDFGVIRLPKPKTRQVPMSVLRTPLTVRAWWFGVELGLGFRTIVPSAAPYGVWVTVLLLPISLVMLSTAAIAFGVGRATVLIGRLVSRDRNAWERKLSHRRSLQHPLSVGALALLLLASVLA